MSATCLKQAEKLLFKAVSYKEPHHMFSRKILKNYCIYSVIRWGFPLSRMTVNNQISPMEFCYNTIPFLNNPNDLDLSYKTDLDFWDCFGRKKPLS